MSNFFLIRSKSQFNKKTLLKTHENLNSKYFEKKKKTIFLKTKNYYYQILLNGITNKNIFRQKKNIVLLFTGNIFNLSIPNQKKISIIDYILIGYLKYGLSFLKKLDGSFSILILDLNNDKIFTVRDRHGSSVLFYYNKRNLLLIFTKIKFLKKNLIVQLIPNWDLIKIYIFKNYRYSYGTVETFFKDIFLFRNNSINLFKKEKLITSNLFSFKINNKKNDDTDKIKKTFLKLLDNSFKKRYFNYK